MKKITFILLHLSFLAAAAQNIQFELKTTDDAPSVATSIMYLDKTMVTDSFGKASAVIPAFQLDLIEIHKENARLNWKLISSSKDSKTEYYVLEVYFLSIEAAVIKATRAGSKEPYQADVVSKGDLEIQNTGRDLPILLQLQPSVVTTSDAGAGVGYTGIRVRGSDASRTNVTLNGVPINDAESQGTFWVNMPDIASSLQSVQLQKGVGSSTNGAGAFGASIHMQTQSNTKAFGNLSQSIGSFGTRKTSIGAGSGLINNHWIVDMHLSNIQSNGFIDRAKSNLQSWNASVAWVGEKFQAKLLHFGGKEHTYQAWWGIPIEKYNGSDSALKDHYYRNIGFTYRNAEDSANLFGSDPRTYNYYTYNNETDNYTQKHYHLYLDYQINNKSRINTTLYGTWGAGYYEQFRPQDDISKYGLKPFVSGTDTLFQSDIVRQRWLDNRLLGINTNYFYENRTLQFTLGTGVHQYSGDHFGEIIWANAAPYSSKNMQYYLSNGNKTDANIFAKTTWKATEHLYLTADLQYRTVKHTGYGNDNDLRKIDFSRSFSFFNPKAGLVYKPNSRNQLFFSVSRANREPSRSDFVDNPANQIPKHEELTDFETGYTFSNSKWMLQTGFYFMYYKNQLVLTGNVNDVGNPLRTNVDNSYRTGVEINGAYEIVKNLQLNGNITVSRNKISKMYYQTLNYTDYSYVTDTLSNTDIAYSPNLTGAAMLTWQLPAKIQINWVHKYVGRQYLDNTQNESRSLQPYYFQELWVKKQFDLSGDSKFNLQLQILNLLDTKYLNNGYTYSYAFGNPGEISRVQEVFVFPSAGRHFTLQASLQF